MTVARPSVPRRALNAFLENMREPMTLAEAAKKAGVSESTIRRRRDDDEEFAKALADAWEHRTDRLEAYVEGRALDPQDPESMKAALFLLRGWRRHVYGEKVEVNATVSAVPLNEARRLQELAAANPDLTVGELTKRLGTAA